MGIIVPVDRSSLEMLFRADAIFLDTNQLSMGIQPGSNERYTNLLQSMLRDDRSLAKRIDAKSFTELCAVYNEIVTRTIKSGRLYLAAGQRPEVEKHGSFTNDFTYRIQNEFPAFSEAAKIQLDTVLKAKQIPIYPQTTDVVKRMYAVQSWANTLSGDAVPWAATDADPLSTVDANIIACAASEAAKPLRPMVHVLTADKSVAFAFEHAAYIPGVFAPGSHLAYGTAYTRKISLVRLEKEHLVHRVASQ